MYLLLALLLLQVRTVCITNYAALRKENTTLTLLKWPFLVKELLSFSTALLLTLKLWQLDVMSKICKILLIHLQMQILFKNGVHLYRCPQNITGIDRTCLNTGNVYFNTFAGLKVYGAVLIAIYFETVLLEVTIYFKVYFWYGCKTRLQSWDKQRRHLRKIWLLMLSWKMLTLRPMLKSLRCTLTTGPWGCNALLMGHNSDYPLKLESCPNIWKKSSAVQTE